MSMFDINKIKKSITIEKVRKAIRKYILEINEIEMEYTPSITIEKVKEAIHKHMPDHEIRWTLPTYYKLVEVIHGDSLIVDKEWATAFGIVSVKHKDTANRTVITYYTTSHFGYTRLYWNESRKLIDRIKEALHAELPNMVR